MSRTSHKGAEQKQRQPGRICPVLSLFSILLYGKPRGAIIRYFLHLLYKHAGMIPVTYGVMHLNGERQQDAVGLPEVFSNRKDRRKVGCLIVDVQVKASEADPWYAGDGKRVRRLVWLGSKFLDPAAFLQVCENVLVELGKVFVIICPDTAERFVIFVENGIAGRHALPIPYPSIHIIAHTELDVTVYDRREHVNERRVKLESIVLEHGKQLCDVQVGRHDKGVPKTHFPLL
jgi:hypothetical protein